MRTTFFPMLTHSSLHVFGYTVHAITSKPTIEIYGTSDRASVSLTNKHSNGYVSPLVAFGKTFRPSRFMIIVIRCYRLRSMLLFLFAFRIIKCLEQNRTKH